MYTFPQIRDQIGMPLCVIAWSLSEIIRYSFYACSLVGNVPYFLQWMRYTFFIFLYPIGVSGELICIYFASRLATFWPWLFFVLNSLMYIPVFPQLYAYMLKQRKKVLGGDKKEKKSN